MRREAERMEEIERPSKKRFIGILESRGNNFILLPSGKYQTVFKGKVRVLDDTDYLYLHSCIWKQNILVNHAITQTRRIVCLCFNTIRRYSLCRRSRFRIFFNPLR